MNGGGGLLYSHLLGVRVIGRVSKALFPEFESKFEPSLRVVGCGAVSEFEAVYFGL